MNILQIIILIAVIVLLNSLFFILYLLGKVHGKSEIFNKFVVKQDSINTAKKFARFVLKNARLSVQRGRLYLQLTDKEIDQIIENGFEDFKKEQLKVICKKNDK